MVRHPSAKRVEQSLAQVEEEPCQELRYLQPTASFRQECRATPRCTPFCTNHQWVPKRAAKYMSNQTWRLQCFEGERSRTTREKDPGCVDTQGNALEPLALALYIANNDNIKVRVCQRSVRESRKPNRQERKVAVPGREDGEQPKGTQLEQDKRSVE